MEKPQMTVDFEKQNFDDLDINPYEIVIAISKMAREINVKAEKFLNPSQEVNPVILALKRFGGNPDFTYENGDGAERKHSEEA